LNVRARFSAGAQQRRSANGRARGGRAGGNAARGHRGFTLVEVLVALVIVAIGLAALMITVSSTARTSGALRDKTLAQWMALNRISEVRLNLNKFGQNTDTGELDFGNRTWHYDTRYFDTSIPSMKRVVVRVYAGNAKTKGNPLAESIGFTGASLGAGGSSNASDWTAGSTPAMTPTGPNGGTSNGGTGNGVAGNGVTGTGTPANGSTGSTGTGSSSGGTTAPPATGPVNQ
jgi:general secretion pathway protein I